MVSFRMESLVKQIPMEIPSPSWELPPTLCSAGDVSSPKPFNSFPAELEEATGKTLRDPGQLGRINSLWSS